MRQIMLILIVVFLAAISLLMFESHTVSCDQSQSKKAIDAYMSGGMSELIGTSETCDLDGPSCLAWDLTAMHIDQIFCAELGCKTLPSFSEEKLRKRYSKVSDKDWSICSGFTKRAAASLF